MISTVQKKNQRVVYLVLTALFSAMAFVAECVFRINVSFLTFDLKDFVITIGAMILGPTSAICISTVVALIEFITVGDTGLWGLLMNWIGSLSFSLTASLIYHYKKTLFGAIFSLIGSIFVTTAMMMVANLLITPLYTGTDMKTVIELIPKLLLPFNFAKAILNAGIVLLFYKPITTVLRKAHLLQGEKKRYAFGRNTVLVILLSVIFLAGSIVLLISLGATTDLF